MRFLAHRWTRWLLALALVSVLTSGCGGATATKDEPGDSAWVARHPHWVTAVALSPDGELALTASLKKTVHLWDVASGRELASLKEKEACWSAEFLDRDRVLLTGGRTVREWRWQDEGGPRARIKAPRMFGSFDRAAVLPGGRTVLTSPNQLCLYELESGKRKTCYGRYLFLGIEDFAVDPSGRIAATARWFGSKIRLWDLEKAEMIGILGDHGDIAMDVIFSHDGRYLLSAGGPTVRVWDVEARREVKTLEGEQGTDVWAIALTPDDSLLVAATVQGTIHLWEMATGEEVRRLLGHRTNPFNLAIGPAGRYLLSGGEDLTARLWDLKRLEQTLQ